MHFEFRVYVSARYVWKTDRCVTLIMLNLKCSFVHSHSHKHTSAFLLVATSFKIEDIQMLENNSSDLGIASCLMHASSQHLIIIIVIINIFFFPFLSQFTFDIYVQNTIIIIIYHTHVAHMAADPQSTIHTTPVSSNVG